MPTAIAIAGGSNQVGTVGQSLDSALTVFVTDKFGDPVPGVLVRFATRSGSLAPVAETTSPSGHAHSVWSLPTIAGDYRATATAAGLDSLTFHALAVPDAPASLTLVTGDSQAALTSSPRDSAVTVQVRDGYGNAVGGIKVSFTPMARSGTVVPASARSDSSGRARTVWTLGTDAGLQGLTIRVDSLKALRVYARGLLGSPIGLPGVADLSSDGWGGDAVLAEPGGTVPTAVASLVAPEQRCWRNAMGSTQLSGGPGSFHTNPDAAAGAGTCDGDAVIF